MSYYTIVFDRRQDSPTVTFYDNNKNSDSDDGVGVGSLVVVIVITAVVIVGVGRYISLKKKGGLKKDENGNQSSRKATISIALTSINNSHQDV